MGQKWLWHRPPYFSSARVEKELRIGCFFKSVIKIINKNNPNVLKQERIHQITHLSYVFIMIYFYNGIVEIIILDITTKKTCRIYYFQISKLVFQYIRAKQVFFAAYRVYKLTLKRMFINVHKLISLFGCTSFLSR